MDALSKVLLFGVVLFALAFFSTSAQDDCSILDNQGCEKCIDNNINNTQLDCYWCDSDKKCRNWKWSGGHLLPTGTDCSGYNWNYQSCSINGVGYAVIISISIFIGLLIIVCCVVCCCVWCARRNKRTWRRHQEKYEDERREISDRSAQRRAERKTRTDEIRRKYGLETDDQTKYEKFV